MAQKRTVFLFGSGATLAWGSPTTLELTKLIREKSFPTTDGKKITQFIYERFLDNGYSCHELNFETIIGVIEELIVHYSHCDRYSKISSASSIFFDARYERDLLNYSIEGGIEKHGYRLQIPAGEEYPISKSAFHNETPSQFFFQQLLSLLLTNIQAEIHEYAYHTRSQSVIDFDSDISKAFVQWMKLLSGSSTLRLYTLNYERIFKILLARAGMDVFEGFDCGEYVEGQNEMRPDVARIHGDAESHVHYNLHGSAFWQVLPLDKRQLPNPEIVLSPIFAVSLANELVSVQMEKGKTLLVAPMISGRQKAQRAMITPFRQMQAAFDRDCSLADEAYVIGYSFGDDHINESLKTAIRYNKKLKITVVDPGFINNQIDHKLALEFDSAFIAQTVTFEEFLGSQLAR